MRCVVNESMKARMLMAAVTDALGRGVRHFHPITKDELKTPLEVLECLRDHGTVHLQPIKKHKEPSR
jgi:hypothetical protein